MRRSGERAIAGKMTIRVDQRKLVLAKGPGESERHVLLKALLFARYVRDYPDILVERGVGLRYKPDLVALGPYQQIQFWGESGETSRQKIGWLIRHVREGHLAFARQSRGADTFPDLVADAVRREGRHGLIEVLSFDDSAWDLIGPDGSINPDAIQPAVTRFEPNLPGTRQR
jgi:uncharacterized protein YaeQ